MMQRLARIFLRCRNAALRPAFARRSPIGEAGFTLIEIAFACEVIMLLTLISFNETRRLREHARVAACLRYQAIIARSMWGQFALDGMFPADAVATLNGLPAGALDKTYQYKPLGGPLRGEYYMQCQHDHSFVAVLFIDSGAYLTPKPIYVLAAARGTIP
jgi:hypothetical protein